MYRTAAGELVKCLALGTHKRIDGLLTVAQIHYRWRLLGSNEVDNLELQGAQVLYFVYLYPAVTLAFVTVNQRVVCHKKQVGKVHKIMLLLVSLIMPCCRHHANEVLQLAVAVEFGKPSIVVNIMVEF